MVIFPYQQVKLDANPLGYVYSLMYISIGLEYKHPLLVAE